MGLRQAKRGLPPIAKGGEVALVRQMMLIDSQNRIIPAPLTESVQIRVLKPAAQDVYEFQFNRARLFASQAGGLRAIEQNERDFLFVQFRGHGVDELEWRNTGNRHANYDSSKSTREVLQSCAICHKDRPVLSIQPVFNKDGPKAILAAKPEEQRQGTVWWKQRQYDWGLLTGLLEGSGASRPAFKPTQGRP